MNDRTVAAQTLAHEDSAKPDRSSAVRSPIRLEIARGRVLSPWRPQAYGANPTESYRSGSLFATLGERSSES